jgi:hypothetical protein
LPGGTISTPATENLDRRPVHPCNCHRFFKKIYRLSRLISLKPSVPSVCKQKLLMTNKN